MIFITAKFPVKPEHADDWPEISRSFTEATRGEDGCLCSTGRAASTTRTSTSSSRAFRDDAAGGAHVQSAHFAAATQELPAYLSATPRIVNTTVPGTEWSGSASSPSGTDGYSRTSRMTAARSPSSRSSARRTVFFTGST